MSDLKKNTEATSEETKDLILFEIYVYNDAQINDGQYEGQLPGTVSGWDTRWVLATPEHITEFPYFDVIITVNDNSTGRRIGAYIWK